MNIPRTALLLAMGSCLLGAAIFGVAAFAWTGSATGSFTAQAGDWSSPTPTPTPPPVQDVQLNVCVHQLVGKVWHAHFSYNNTTGDKINLAKSTVTWDWLQLPLWRLPLLPGSHHAFGALFLSDTPVTWTVVTKQGATFSATASTSSPLCPKPEWTGCGADYHGSGSGIPFGITSLDGDVEEEEPAAGPRSFAAPSSTTDDADAPAEDNATPANDDATPANNDAAPTGDDAAPTGDEDASAPEDATPTEEAEDSPTDADAATPTNKPAPPPKKAKVHGEVNAGSFISND